MSSAVQPPPLGVASASVLRVFAAEPFHTDGDLLALAFSADETLWSVEEPGVLRHWDVVHRRQIGWRQLDEMATLWAFSADAKLLVSGSDELTVWEVETGEALASYTQPSWVTALAFHPEGRLLASGHDDGIVRLWDWESQKLIRAIAAHPSPVSALAFRADGKTLATAGEDRQICLWDVSSGKQTGILEGHTDRIPAIAWQPGRPRLVSVGWDTTARVWDVEKCEPVILLNTHSGQVHALAFNTDGSRLACADSAQSVHLWDALNHRPMQVLHPQAGELRCLAYSPAGRLASGGASHVVHVSEPGEAREVPAATSAVPNRAKRSPFLGPAVDTPAPVDPLLARHGITVTHGGQRLVHLGVGTGLRLWDVQTNEKAAEPQVVPPLHAFAASPEGRRVVASLADRDNPTSTPARLLLLDGDTGKRLQMIVGPTMPVTALAYNPDGNGFASGSYQSSDVWLWNDVTGESTCILPNAVESYSVEQLAYHPAGRLLAISGVDWFSSSDADGAVSLWDVIDRRQIASLPGGATGLSFHPNGRFLATASLVRSVRIWDLETKDQTLELLGHEQSVTCVAYSADGRWLASGGDDHRVRLWDAVSGEAVGIAALDTQPKALAFSPDGRFLFTGNGNASAYQLELSRLLHDGI